MTSSREERSVQLEKLRAIVQSTREDSADFYIEKRVMPYSTENHVKALVAEVRNVFPGQTAEQIALLQEFEIFSYGQILPIAAAINAAAVIRFDSGDFQAALSQAERVHLIWAIDNYNHWLISRCREELELDGPGLEPLDEYLKKSFCNVPFRHMEITNAGEASLCCPGWVPLPAGNVLEQDPAEVWNSPAAQAVRRAILDGTFKYCSRLLCNPMQTRTLPPRTMDATLDRPDRYPSAPYRGYSLWIWNGGWVAARGEPPALDVADFAAAEQGTYFFGRQLEDLKAEVDRFLSPPRGDAMVALADSSEAVKAEVDRFLSPPRVEAMVALADPSEAAMLVPRNFYGDTARYLRELSTEEVDAYVVNDVYYAVPRGEPVSRRTLESRLHSCTLVALNEGSLKAAIARYESDAVLDVDSRPFPHFELMPRVPFNAAFSHDRTCNISCPSCRTEVLTATRDEQAVFDAMISRMLNFLRGVHFLTVTGGGDPFASRHYRQLLKFLKGRSIAKISLLTNALLLDERAWQELDLEGRVAVITVSIDAATQETYERVRRGSKWPILLQRLQFISGLRRDNIFRNFQTNFTVQNSNYREMPDFVQFSLDHAMDKIKFSRVMNIGAYTAEEYARENVFSDQHPNHQDLLNVLRHPIFGHANVDLGNCAAFRQAI